MEPRLIVIQLFRHRLALIVVLAAARALAYLAGSRAPLTTTGAATTQILIDAPQSALANLKQNTIPLTTRAGMFAQFMAGTAVRSSIASEASLSATEIVAKGPFDDSEAAPTGIATGTPAGTTSDALPAYVLTFVAPEELPLVTVYAQAPDPADGGPVADPLERDWFPPAGVR